MNMNHWAASVILVLSPSLAWGQEAAPPVHGDASVEALKTEVESLRVPKLAWREIAWKSCLLEGLKESRAQGKPVLLWIFIDRPVDDARC